MCTCIVLNGDFKFLNTVSWKRAICLYLQKKVEVLEFSDYVVRTIKSVIRVPLVVKLIKVVRSIYKSKVPFSKKNVLIRDNFTCVYCGSKRDLTIDHLVPVSRGGKTNFENCVASCKNCNGSKGNRTCTEANMFPSKQPYQLTTSEFLNLRSRKLGVDSYLRKLGVY